MTYVAGDPRLRPSPRNQLAQRLAFPSERGIVGRTFPRGGVLSPDQFMAIQRQRSRYARNTSRQEPGIT